MDYRLQAGKPTWYVSQPHRST